MDVADLREEVVLDLEIQPADIPGKQSTPACKIDGRFNLMLRPG